MLTDNPTSNLGTHGGFAQIVESSDGPVCKKAGRPYCSTLVVLDHCRNLTLIGVGSLPNPSGLLRGAESDGVVGASYEIVLKMVRSIPNP